MITTANYYDVISRVKKNELTPELQRSASFVDEVSNNGKDWSLYREDDVVKRTIDTYFSLLDDIVNVPAKKQTESQSKKPANSLRSRVTPRATKTPSSLRIVKRKGQEVERISEELRFLKSYVTMDGKTKTIDQIRSFIGRLQRAIAEKRLRKTSPYAKDIDDLQDDLIRLHNNMLGSKGRKERVIEIKQEKKNHLLNLVGKQELMQSVKFIKSYIGLQGKEIPNNKAKALHNRIARAVNNEFVTEKDPYWKQLEEVMAGLRTFVSKYPTKGILSIPSRELNGLNGVLSGFETTESVQALREDMPLKNVMMNSMDFVKMKFNKIGFTGKWLDFIGNPSKGFLILVHGQPKYGKSIMCVDLARYLAENFGMVLYVAKEEGLDDTLRDKLEQSAHPNLIVSDYLPDTFEGFDYVFLDSITRLGLRPEDLLRLKDQNPGVSIIAISQVTKAGKARGSNMFSHDVDSIIDFPERGKAVQYGRFNQGGELNVFQ